MSILKLAALRKKLSAGLLAVLVGVTLGGGILLLPQIAKADSKPGGKTTIYANWRLFGFCLGPTEKICEIHEYHQ